MEQFMRIASKSNTRISKKLDKLADDIKKLPAERQDKLKNLISKKAYSTKDAAIQLASPSLHCPFSGLELFLFSRRPSYQIPADEIERFGNVVKSERGC